MPGRRDIASVQYMLASPIRVNSTSQPSAAKASASTSDSLAAMIRISLWTKQAAEEGLQGAPEQAEGAELGRLARRRAVAVVGGGWRAAGAASGAAAAGAGSAGARSATSFAMLAENSASSARATCTPPALAKVSSGPVTVKLPATASRVAPPSAAACTVAAASAREAPRPSIPRPSMLQRCAAWS